MTPLLVACATDDGYAPHCAAMLHSLLAHHPAGSVQVYVLHGTGTLSEASRGRLSEVAAGGDAAIDWLEVRPADIAAFPATRFHPACWYRVLLPDLLPRAPRVLYLDADLIVLEPLDELWSADLRGRAFAAVVNPLYPFMPDRAATLGLASASEYLNSGVLLMDLERMRATGLAARLRAYAQDHPDNPWPEQDALSVVCRGEWAALPPRWNAQTTVFDLADGQLPYPPDQAREARQRPAIVHFIGPLKPWTYLCRHPLRHVYARHRRQTPWGEFEPEGRTLANRLLRPLSLGAQLKARALYRTLVRRWLPAQR